jgi:hypothetical protein
MHKDRTKIKRLLKNIVSDNFNERLSSFCEISYKELNKEIATALFNIESPKLIAFNLGSLSSIKNESEITESLALIAAENCRISLKEISIGIIVIVEPSAEV